MSGRLSDTSEASSVSKCPKEIPRPQPLEDWHFLDPSHFPPLVDAPNLPSSHSKLSRQKNRWQAVFLWQGSTYGTPEGSAEGWASNSQKSRSVKWLKLEGCICGDAFLFGKGDACGCILGTVWSFFSGILLLEGVAILLYLGDSSTPRCCAKSLKALLGGSTLMGFGGPKPLRSDPDQSAGLISPDFNGSQARSKDTRGRAPDTPGASPDARARGARARSVTSCGQARGVLRGCSGDLRTATTTQFLPYTTQPVFSCEQIYFYFVPRPDGLMETDTKCPKIQVTRLRDRSNKHRRDFGTHWSINHWKLDHQPFPRCWLRLLLASVYLSSLCSLNKICKVNQKCDPKMNLFAIRKRTQPFPSMQLHQNMISNLIHLSHVEKTEFFSGCRAFFGPNWGTERLSSGEICGPTASSERNVSHHHHLIDITEVQTMVAWNHHDIPGFDSITSVSFRICGYLHANQKVFRI